MTLRGGTADEQLHALDVAVRRADLSMEDLWVRYFTLGGDAGMMEIEAYLNGLMELPSGQRDVLAHAVNERLDDVTTRLRVPYSRTLRDPAPVSGPLAALVELLEGTQQAAPEMLVQHLAVAAAALDVQATLHLVDYGQRRLVPVRSQAAHPGRLLAGEASGVDSTMAGQAFQRGEIVAGHGAGRPRLWVPVLDGVERLGVLEVTAQDARDLDDPQLRRDCLWVANLVGHLVSAVDATGDALDAIRRVQPRTASAELVWNLLPPLTAGTDRFVVAGQLEPCERIGGDAFDYALAEDVARLAIFDATGHSLGSGLATTAALAAYRNARRSGAGLVAQAAAVDEVIATVYADRYMYVSGILAEVDLTSGRLRYVIAGHPAPFLLRGGTVVKTLTGDGRGLFGLPQRTTTVTEESLEPGDRLLLYTDGVTEARDHEGRFFGVDRLQTFIERADAAGFPPPETVRRLTAAVMEHQDGLLQDDATVLLASWLPGPRDLLVPGRGAAGRAAADERDRPGADGLVRALDRLGRVVGAEGGTQAAADAVVAAALHLVPGARQAGLTVVRAYRHLVTVAATSELPAAVDRAQLAAGEGPCLEAVYASRTAVVPDTDAEPRWPAFASSARDLGVRSALSVPLHVPGRGPGALTLLSDQPHAFDEQSAQVALLLAPYAAAAAERSGADDGPARPLSADDTVDLATGIVMARYGMTSAHASALLARLSSEDARALHGLAAEVVGALDLPGAPPVRT